MITSSSNPLTAPELTPAVTYRYRAAYGASIAIVCALLISPLLLWLYHTGNPLLYIQQSAPAGQWAYVLSKLMGLYAVSALALQLLIGLHRQSVLWAKRQALWHQINGMVTTVTFLLHIGLFILAASLRGQHIAWTLLLPNLKGYFNQGITIGLLAGGLLLSIIIAGYRLRANKRKVNQQPRVSPRPWRLLHHLALPAFTLVIIHSLMIGTEANTYAMKLYYLSLIALVVLALGEKRFSNTPAGSINRQAINHWKP